MYGPISWKWGFSPNRIPCLLSTLNKYILKVIGNGMSVYILRNGLLGVKRNCCEWTYQNDSICRKKRLTCEKCWPIWTQMRRTMETESLRKTSQTLRDRAAWMPVFCNPCLSRQNFSNLLDCTFRWTDKQTLLMGIYFSTNESMQRYWAQANVFAWIAYTVYAFGFVICDLHIYNSYTAARKWRTIRMPDIYEGCGSNWTTGGYFVGGCVCMLIEISTCWHTNRKLRAEPTHANATRLRNDISFWKIEHFPAKRCEIAEVAMQYSVFGQ